MSWGEMGQLARQTTAAPEIPGFCDSLTNHCGPDRTVHKILNNL